MINKEWLAAQSKRRKRLIENAILFAQLAPKEGRGPVGGIDWAPETTDGLRAAANAATERFNRAAEVIDAHHHKGHFGLRFERGIDHPDSDKRGDAWDPESAPKLAIWLAPCGDAAAMTPHRAIALAGNILDMLSASGTAYEHADPPPTLTKRKQADVYDSWISIGQAELWKRARWTAFNNFAGDLGEEQARQLCELAPWYFDKERLLVLGHLLPKEGAAWQWGPEIWDLMSDFLFMASLPEKAFREQISGRNGWFNKKGRKLKRFIGARASADLLYQTLDRPTHRRWRWWGPLAG